MPSPVWVRLFRLALRGLFRLVFRVRVIGVGNVPSTPFVACANHLGWVDAFLVLLFFPSRPRVYVLGEQEVKYISGFRTRLIDALGVMVMLDRNKPREALRVMSDVLSRGGSLLIFPEGHLGTQEGKISELQHGAAHISLLSDVPLLPVGLTGPSELWLRRTLTMRIGPPIPPDNYTGDLRTRLHTLTDALDAAMRALLPGDHARPRLKLLSRWLTDLF